MKHEPHDSGNMKASARGDNIDVTECSSIFNLSSLCTCDIIISTQNAYLFKVSA